MKETQKLLPEANSEKEIKQRKDFRDVLTFTIDPVDAKDFDDAISIKKINEDL
jgi:ribonuclease R